MAVIGLYGPLTLAISTISALLYGGTQMWLYFAMEKVQISEKTPCNTVDTSVKYDKTVSIRRLSYVIQTVDR